MARRLRSLIRSSNAEERTATCAMREKYIQADPVCGFLLFLAYNGGPVGWASVVRPWLCTSLQDSSLMVRKLMINTHHKEGEGHSSRGFVEVAEERTATCSKRYFIKDLHHQKIIKNWFKDLQAKVRIWP